MITNEEYIQTEEQVKRYLGSKYRSTQGPMSLYDINVRQELLSKPFTGLKDYINKILASSPDYMFERNKCIGNRYFADFTCVQHKLIIQTAKTNDDYNKKRNQFLKAMGYRVESLLVYRQDQWPFLIRSVILKSLKKIDQNMDLRPTKFI